MENIAITILQVLVLITGLFDAYKYKFMAQKVARLKSSRGNSRKFLNASIISRLVLLAYVWFGLHDWILTIVSLIALYTMGEAYYYVYCYYPYRNRGLKNFKKPSIVKFIRHSLSLKRNKKRL